MLHNIDPKTGIHYGIISENSLEGWVVEELMWGSQARNHTEEALIKEGQFESLDYIEEPEVSGIYEEVEYTTCWLGGALNFLILYSPHKTKTNLCSPCVPNAGNLDDVEGGDTETFDVPNDWRREW